MKFYPERSKKENKDSAFGMAGNVRGSRYLLPVIALMVAFAAIVTFSWLRIIRDTVFGGSVTSDDYRLFELGAITNNAGTSRDVDVAANVLDTMSSYGAQEYGRNILETDETKDGVLCALEPTGEPALRPGAYGTLRFRILPRTAGREYYATYSLTGIKKVVDLEHSIVTYEKMDPLDQDDADVIDLLNGHILFFTDSAHTTRIDSDNVLRIQGATTAGSEYVVTLYRVWPRTYTAHSAFVNDAWRLTHTYLANGTGDAGYNNADQVIGEAISYVVVELDVTGTAVDTSATQRTVTATVLS